MVTSPQIKNRLPVVWRGGSFWLASGKRNKPDYLLVSDFLLFFLVSVAKYCITPININGCGAFVNNLLHQFRAITGDGQLNNPGWLAVWRIAPQVVCFLPKFLTLDGYAIIPTPFIPVPT